MIVAVVFLVIVMDGQGIGGDGCRFVKSLWKAPVFMEKKCELIWSCHRCEM
jgi:hypothetical protein